MSVAIVGAGAVSPSGLGWRGLADARPAARPTLLAETHPDVRGFETPPIAPEHDAGDLKSRRLMSRSARFAAIAAREALRESGWSKRDDVGFWLGCGASGGPIGELVKVLALSRENGAVSLAKLGVEGLAASNPLNTFQVLNNFAMCHGAILEGIMGPNSALFSRGAGTVHALAEAVFAIEDGDCDRALAGGADTALYPITWSELVRDGCVSHGFVPSEGAGIVALARSDDPGALAIVERVAVVEDASLSIDAESVVIAPWGDPARSRLHALVGDRPALDITARSGDALAATPALAWLAALDLVVSERARRVAVLSIGTDDELGVVVLRGVA